MNPAWDGSLAAHWRSSHATNFATPGVANSVLCTASNYCAEPAVVKSVRHEPSQPLPDSNVMVQVVVAKAVAVSLLVQQVFLFSF